MKRCTHTYRTQLLALAGVSALVLSGCATLSKSECLSGNWSVIGNADGANGRVISEQLKGHNKACSKHGVSIDQDAYMRGYNEGIARYCTTESGYSAGAEFGRSSYSRKGYNNVCPSDLELAFLEGYVSALKLNLESVHGKLAEKRSEMESSAGVFLLLKALNSSRADQMEEDMESSETTVTEMETTVKDTIEEIEKWITARPELRSIVDG